MAGREVRVAILGDSRDFSRAVKSASDDAGRLDGAFSKIGGAAKAAALGLVGAATGAAFLAKSAIDAGSDLNETISKSNTVFGSQAQAIDDWSRTAATAFGQSRKQALEAASSFGNMFSQLGIGDEQAASMSKSMTELASDFASFHNADISEVLMAQQAAFRGEYDAVQRFVPTINAAAVEQKALAMGLGKTTKELDAQDKAIAVQTLLMEGAGDAMGDFARTSDGLANKQRIMSARFEDVKAKIGQGLIPVALKLAGFLSDKVLPAFEELGGGIMAFVGAFQAADGEITSAGFPGFMERVAFIARQAFDRISEKVREWGPVVVAAFQTVVAFVQEHWPEIQRIIKSEIETIVTVVSGAVEIITTLWDNFGNNILEFVQRVWPRVQQVIEGALQIIRGIVQTVTSLIKGDWSEVWEGIKTIFSGAWEAIQGTLGTATEALRVALGVALETLGSMFKGAWNGLVQWFAQTVPSAIGKWAGKAWEALKEGLAAAVTWVIGQIDKMLGPIDEALGKLGKIKGAFSGDGGAQGDRFRNLTSRAQGGIVPGSLGQPRLILAHGGERLDTHGQQMRSGGGGVPVQIIIQTGADPQAVVEAIKRYTRSNGPLPANLVA